MINDFRGEYRWLSNFHYCEIEFEGITYPSTEHAYQAAKTLNKYHRQMIAGLKTCREAKAEGYKVQLRPGWDQMKLGIMLGLLWQKFNRHPDLREKLKATGTQDLVEGNTWGDRFWGVCEGTGENWLGRLLMEIRADL